MPGAKVDAKRPRRVRKRKSRTTDISSDSSSDPSESDDAVERLVKIARKEQQQKVSPHSQEGSHSKDIKDSTNTNERSLVATSIRPTGVEHGSSTTPSEQDSDEDAEQGKDADDDRNDSRLQSDHEDQLEVANPQADHQAEQNGGPERTALDQKTDSFEAWYLRMVTEQYAADLDRLRQAADFKDSSVPMLIQALKQGASAYSESERTSLTGKGFQ